MSEAEKPLKRNSKQTKQSCKLLFAYTPGRETDTEREGGCWWKEMYVRNENLLRWKLQIFNQTCFYFQHQTIPGNADGWSHVISVLNRPHCSLSLQGSNRIAHGFREFILTECRFSFEHAQLISQKTSFCLSPFGIKIRKESRSGNKTKHSRSLSNQPFWIFSSSASSDEFYLNKCTDGGIKLWFAVKWWLRHWFASCCNGIIEQVSKQTPLLYIRDRLSVCSYSYSAVLCANSASVFILQRCCKSRVCNENYMQQ